MSSEASFAALRAFVAEVAAMDAEALGMVIAALQGASGEDAGLRVEIARVAYARATARADADAARADIDTLRGLAEMAPALIALTTGPDHELTWVNEQFRATSWTALPSPLRAHCDLVFSTGAPIAAQELRLGEGWFNLLLAPWRGPDGDVRGVWLHGVDVTEQVRARKDAEAARANMASAIMQAPAMIAIRRGPDHVFEMVNDAYLAAIQGRNVIGLPARDAIPDVARTGLYDVLDRVYRTGEVHVGKETRVVVDGKEGWYDFAFQAIRDADGAVSGTMVHAVEITEQVLARKEAEAARARYRDLVQSVDAIVWESPPFGTEFSFVSDRAETMLGYPIARWQERGFWRSILHPDDRARVVDLSERSVREARGHELEYRVLAADGRVVWLQDVTRVLTDASGRAEQLRGLMIDITARKEAEFERERMQAQLLQVQKLDSLGVLAGGIAHDFNNLLTVILGNASLASLRLPEDSPVRQPIDDLVATAQRAADLTRQLLAYSGRAPFRAEALDLSAQVREIVGILEATIPKKVKLRLSLTPALPVILADPAQVQQVVMNLVLNAAEAIESTGTVRVVTREELVREAPLVGIEAISPGRHVVLDVIDDGAGMNAEVRAQIFDPFFTTHAQGRGLGLAAVLGIVRGHKGGIRIETEPGRGSRFSIYFPASTAKVAPAPARAGDFPRGRGLVLLVDDEIDVRMTARAMLEHLGYDVVEASDGRAGIEGFAKHAGELVAVLLDWTMPVMDGEEVFRALQELDPRVPVILSSGYTEYDARRRGMPEGLAGFLQKPYTVRQLGEAIAVARA